MNPEQKANLYTGIKIFVIVLLAVAAAGVLFGKNYDRGDKTKNTITFSGHGEVTAVPDIANVDFSIVKDAKTVKEAQVMVAEVEKKALEFLRSNNVLDKDIKTLYATFNPKYDYIYDSKSGVPCTLYNCPRENVIIGYTATESVSVKVRNTDDLGKIIEGLGALGVTDLSGPNFKVEKEEELKAEARKKAIDEAKEKAKLLAKQLGVRLGKISSFSETNNYPVPMMYGTVMEKTLDSARSAELPKGENTITSDVTVTYEIR